MIYDETTSSIIENRVDHTFDAFHFATSQVVRVEVALASEVALVLLAEVACAISVS